MWAQSTSDSSSVSAEPNLSFEHELIRRLAVFPPKADKSLDSITEEMWWNTREILTENKRFLVASKNFMVNKDVYQARAELSPADVIILGRLLDAHALVVTYLEERQLHMKVYGGEFGRTIWQESIDLHPSVPIASQIESASRKLVLDFLASIPYQGFVEIDSLEGRPVFERDGRKYVKVNIGVNSQVQLGDRVQLIQIYSDRLSSLFNSPYELSVRAEGRVIRVVREVATVELTRAVDVNEIQRNMLVRVPSEYQRLRDLFALKDRSKKGAEGELFRYRDSQLTKLEREAKPLVTALSFIGNIALILLLAF